MDHILSIIEAWHTLPVNKRPLKELHDSHDDVANPIYEIEDYLRDRIVLDPPKHDGIYCDNPDCSYSLAKEDEFISGLRYYCLDCVVDQVDFCSRCVVLPGQGIEHDPTHRLVKLLPTKCAICQGITPLKKHPGDSLGFRGPYREYSALGGTLKRVGEARACTFCVFIWNAFMQHPLDGIQWPPSEDDKVTIRIRQPPWHSWLEIAVPSDVGMTEHDIELFGERYILQQQNSADAERALQVGIPKGKSGHISKRATALTTNYLGLLEESHEMAVNPTASYDKRYHLYNIARVQKSSASDEALTLTKKWLNNCRENHTLCNELDPTALPTRLVDLQGKDPGRVYLRKTWGEAVEYAALSYCWGQGAPGLYTNESNFQSHCEEGIGIEDLPKTIREAIHAAKTLGLRYLWVDRLCIIQDSPQDWFHETGLMCAVYSGATVTLSADGSTSATEGLFQTDQALSKLNYQEYVNPDREVTSLVLIEPKYHATVEARIEKISQAIDTRAWTMQERLMSRRVLHFTSDEMAWECNTLTECECRRESSVFSRELSPSGLQDMESIYNAWRRMAYAYAKRSLSNDSDKFPALQGLVAKFQLLMAGISGAGTEQPDEYLAGLWRGDLVSQMVWKPAIKNDLEAYLKYTDTKTIEIDNTGEPENKGAEDWSAIMKARGKHQDWREAKGYVAPSWSWAHLRGPISYLTCYPETPFKSYAEVIEARVVPIRHDEPTGPVASGSITLNGHMVRGLSFLAGQLISTHGNVKDRCILWKQAHGYSWSIEFEPDDRAGWIRRRGSIVSDVVLLLLGTKDQQNKTSQTGKFIVTGMTPPMDRFRSKKEEEDVLEAGVESSDMESSLPEELLHAFRDDSGATCRYSFYLVLVESQEQKGKYERIGCFEVWIETDVMESLFHDSEKGQISII